MAVLSGNATITNYDVPGSDPFDATATYTPGGTAILHDLLETAAGGRAIRLRVRRQCPDARPHAGHRQSRGRRAIRRGAHQRRVRRPDQRPRSADRQPSTCRRRRTNYTLQLLHLSDGEAGLLAPQTAPNLAALVDAFDDDFANTLILSGGDNFLAGPFLAGGHGSVRHGDAQRGDGLDHRSDHATSRSAPSTSRSSTRSVSRPRRIGNHEFDLGSRVLRDAFSPNLRAAGWVGAHFPYLSANLDFSGDADLNPRFTNTLDGGTGTLVPEASTLKGRIAPSAVITEGGEKIGLVGRDHPAPRVDLVADRHGGERLSDRAGRQRRSRQHGSARVRSCSRSSTS